MDNNANKCCFQFISFEVSIPQIRKMKFSRGATKSRNVFSPLKTFEMYFPRGIASATVITKVAITPSNSVFLYQYFKA